MVNSPVALGQAKSIAVDLFAGFPVPDYQPGILQAAVAASRLSIGRQTHRL
jgi:hypothetical protein